MDDLFGANNDLEQLQMQDSLVYYASAIVLPFDAKTLLEKFIVEIPWRSEKVTVWGKSHVQPRLIAWYGDAGRSYSYSGIAMNPLPWTEELKILKSLIEGIAGEDFNSVLLNYYRNEHDGMGFHSDNEKELGGEPTIASLSLGEQRTFVFKHKTAKNLKPVRLKLNSGSLLVMKGETQKYWKHGIDKEMNPCGPRVNLTFRKILTSKK